MNHSKSTVETTTDYRLLIEQLKESSALLKAEVLAAVLKTADETNPHFKDVLAALSESEQALVIGTLLEASRLDPSAERRLWRLNQLLKVMPETSRGLFWAEAESLQTGEDATLILLGMVKALPGNFQPLALKNLRTAVRRVPDVFKRAMAYLALSELTKLSSPEWREAELCASRIPNDILRIMTQTRLAKAKRL